MDDISWWNEAILSTQKQDYRLQIEFSENLEPKRQNYGVLPTRIAFFRAQDVNVVEDTIADQSEMLKELTLGWKKIFGTVDVHFVPGNHIPLLSLSENICHF